MPSVLFPFFLVCHSEACCGRFEFLIVEAEHELLPCPSCGHPYELEDVLPVARYHLEQALRHRRGHFGPLADDTRDPLHARNERFKVRIPEANIE